MAERLLNEAQEEAVNFGNGPLLIIAGAGTGKTTVITERVKHLVTTKLAKSSEILALTFTEKAATEMETRIDEVLPYGETSMWIMTFHGFCDRILKQDGFHIGLDTRYKLLTTAESIDLLKRNLYSLGLDYFAPLGNPTKFLFGLLAHFSRLQDENISPDEYLTWTQSLTQVASSEKKLSDADLVLELENKKWRELAAAFKKYEELKIKNSLFDFGDLITKTILLFEKRPNVLAQYRKQFKYILVDEFQDTNYAQNKLVMLLSGAEGNITVVGDDDQSIYRFRGAAVSNMLQFRSHFPNTKVVTLTENYRSKQRILDVAHHFISHNNPDRLEVLENINKKLTAQRLGTATIEFCHTTQVTEEADFVVQKIVELQKKEELQFSDFAILVRANNHADAFIRAFESAGIPYQFLGPGKLFLEPLVTDLISYLQVISDIHNDAAVFQLFSSDIVSIPSLELAALSSLSRREHRFLFDVLQNPSELVSKDTKEKLTLLFEILNDNIARSRSESAGSLLLDFVVRSGVKEALLSEEMGSGDVVKNAQNMEKFFEKIKNFEVANPQSRVSDVVNWINLQTEVGESPAAAEIDWSAEDKVNILTIHSSKGLEFPVVFLVNLVSQRFPSMERREQIPIPEALIREVLPTGDFHLQEERRLFYVGITRAKDYLYLTGSDFYGEAKRIKKISPFVSEALGDIKSSSHPKKKEVEENSVTDAQKLQPIHIKSLSYSEIESFKICPLHYKLSSLLKIPTKPSAAQSFGISIHNSLKEFHEQVLAGSLPSADLLKKTLTREWKQEGYSSAEHVKKAHEKAETFLDYYYNHWFDPNTVVLALEKEFSFRLGNLSIRGKIDRIEKTSQGIQILDYKTGSSALTQKEADQNLQLSLYALAATKIQDAPFGQLPEEITLSLVYFDDPQIVTTKRTKAQLALAEKEILEWREKIEESDFSCSGNFLCQSCEYKTYCAAALHSD